MKRSLLTLTLLLAAGCGGGEVGGGQTTSTTAPPPSLPPLVVEYGCGYGFHLGSEDQTVALLATFTGKEPFGEGEIPPVSQLPHEQWRVELTRGEDLFANWCDDVMEPDEPQPVVEETWTVTAGTIRITQLPESDCTGPARAELDGLVATTAGGEQIELGSFTVENPHWGCFAG